MLQGYTKMYLFIIANITQAMKDKNISIEELSEKLGNSIEDIREKIKVLDILFIEKICKILDKRFDFIISDEFNFTDEEFDKAFDNAESEMLLQFILPEK